MQPDLGGIFPPCAGAKGWTRDGEGVDESVKVSLLNFHSPLMEERNGGTLYSLEKFGNAVRATVHPDPSRKRSFNLENAIQTGLI